MRDLIIWKILLIGFHFDIRDNKVSNLLNKMPQSHTLEVQKCGNMQNTLKMDYLKKKISLQQKLESL